MELRSTKDLVLYFRDEIEKLGFVTDPNGVRGWFLQYGPFERYSVYIDALGYIDNVWTIKLYQPHPIIDKEGRMLAFSSGVVREIAVGRVTKYWSPELDFENIKSLLEYINNMDGVKSRLRKKKLKRINGRLESKVQGTRSTHIRVE